LGTFLMPHGEPRFVDTSTRDGLTDIHPIDLSIFGEYS